MKKKRYASLLCVMLSVAMLAGCSSQKGEGGQGSEPGSESGRKKTEIVIAQGADASSLDPQKQSDTVSGNLVANIFDPLICREKDMSLQPCLATEWSQIDETTWEVVLREEVKFHDGEDFNADAVVFTFERVKNPETKALNASYFSTIESCEKLDDYKVKFTTNGTDPIFEARLSNLYILPPEYVEEKGEKFGQDPVGTGAYTFGEWVKDDKITLEKNPDYFGEKPFYEKVTYKAIPETATQIAALQSGEVDIIPSIPSDQIANLEVDGNIAIKTAECARIQMVNFNMTTELGQNKNLRLAIAHAINREPIVNGLLSGYGKELQIPISDVIPGIPTDIKAYPYDVEKAKEYLTKAGYPDGIDIQIECQNGLNPFDKEIAQVVGQQLNEVGIRATVQPLEQSTHSNKLRAKEITPIYVMSGNNVWFDIDPQLKAFFLSSGPLSTCVNDRVDELIKAGEKAVPEERKVIYQEAFEIIRDEALGIPVIQYKMIAATNKDVNWSPRIDGRVRAHEAK